MRSKIMLLLLGFIVFVFNYSIYQNEQVKEDGQILLLKLVPVDPRSLMQGDYMRLHYALANSIRQDSVPKHVKYIVIARDENNVGHFVRFYNGEQLAKKENIFRFYFGSSISIRPDTFFFQEGHAKYYEDAKYAVFKVDNSGKLLLTDLADESRNAIHVHIR